MTRSQLLINGQPVSAQSRSAVTPPQPSKPPVRPSCHPPCCATPGGANGDHAEGCIWRPTPTRVFDHLTGTPEDGPLSRVAHYLRRGALPSGHVGPVAWWESVPEREELTAVNGEVGP